MCEAILGESQSCADILGVISLPLEIAQCDQSSFIQQYMNTKYQEHDNRFEKLQNYINYINMISEEKIKQSKHLVKEEMNLMISNQHLAKINDIQSIDQWFAVSKELNKKSKQINILIDEYYLDIKDLEQNRSSEIKDMLRGYKEEVIKLRLCSPDETNTLVEELIIELNKKMVNYAQQNEDYKLQLNLEAQQFSDECAKLLKNKCTYIADIRAQNLWKKIKEKQSQRLLVQTIFNLSRENIKAKEEISQATSRLVLGLSEFAEVLKAPTDVDIDENLRKQWFGMLNTRLESLESLCERVQLLLKTAITSLLETFDNKINSLMRTLYPNVEILSESICTAQEVSNEIQILKEQQAKELKIIHDNWQEIMDTLSKKIYQSKGFVSDLTSIWTNHTNRRNKLIAELEVELENQKRKWLKEESIINLKIKKLTKDIREAKDLQTLGNYCAALENTLSDLKDKWEQHYDSQQQKVKAVRRNTIDLLIERQIAGIREFLFVKYPKKQWFDESFSLKLKSSGADQASQIEMCNTFLKSVDNRTLGMHEMLERYMPACPSAIMEESEDWLYVCIQDIVNNYESEFQEIVKIHEETLQELKQTRSAELQIHSDRLMSHSSGIKSILVKLNKQYDDIKLHKDDEMSKFNEKLQHISQDHNNLSFSKKIKDSIMQINEDWAIMCKSLESDISEAKQLCYSEINLLNNSNNKFCQNAKSFKNGGNYSLEELKYMKKEINQLKKLIMSHNRTLTDNYNRLSKNITCSALDATVFDLKIKHDKIKLKEDLITSLNETRLRLRRSASEIGAMGDSVEEKITHMKAINEKWVDNVQTFEDFNDTFQQIINIANKRLDHLKSPSELLTAECFLNINKTLLDSSNKAPEIVNGDEIQNKTVSFLHESKKYILNQFFNMDQNIQKVFGSYQGAEKQKRKNSRSTHYYGNEFEETITNHTNQLKSILMNYYEECKAVCIQESQNYIQQMNRLCSVLNLIIKQSFNKVHKTYLVNLNDLENWYNKTVEHKCEAGDKSRNQIERNLVLPLAHPNHKHRLKELFERATEICTSQKEDLGEILCTYKGMLKNMHDKYVEKMSSLRNNFEGMQSIVPNIESLKSSLSDISALSNQHYFEYETDKTTTTKYPLSIWSGSREDIQINNKLTQLLSKNISNEERTDSQWFGEESVICLATENLKLSAVHVQKLYDEARYRVIQYVEAIKKWLHSIEYNMNQAQIIHTKV